MRPFLMKEMEPERFAIVEWMGKCQALSPCPTVFTPLLSFLSDHDHTLFVTFCLAGDFLKLPNRLNCKLFQLFQILLLCHQRLEFLDVANID